MWPLLCICSALALLTPALRAASNDSISAVEGAQVSLAEAVQDNSFLIEEAYNQEPGVVQHIWNGLYSVTRHPGAEPDERSWVFTFTQEWPVFSQTHQFSYSVPYSFVRSEGHSVDGIGDIALNYRLQVLMETKTRPAFAPRFTLILPTGDASKGLGNDVFGYQTNLPISKIVSERWTLHGNAGATYLPDVDGHDLLSYNLGASAIFAATRQLNFMLELVGNWEEQVSDFDRAERDLSAVISPGFRYAFNHPNDAQTVIGLALPIGITSAAPDVGVFLYASFEHLFYRPKKH
jgi:hypothetical protein